MSNSQSLRALLEVNQMFIAEQREINAALINTFIGVCMGSRHAGIVEPISITELSRRIGLQPTTVSRHVRYLGPGPRAGREGIGLVEMVPSPEDGRERLIRLTLKGEALLGRMLMAGL